MTKQNYITRRVTISRFLDQMYSYNPHLLSESDGLLIHPDTIKEFASLMGVEDYDGSGKNDLIQGHPVIPSNIIKRGYIGLIKFPTEKAKNYE